MDRCDVTALRPEYDTVREHLQAAIAESKAASRYQALASEAAGKDQVYLAITAANFHGAAYGHAFRAAELAYDLGVAQGAPCHALPTRPPTTDAPPTNAAPSARVPVNMAQALRRARATTTLSQKRLAEQVGLDPSYLSMAEGGKRVPKIEALILIAEALNMNLSTLIALGEGPATP
jgi:DNA-binding XRE family transcriptional regulator